MLFKNLFPFTAAPSKKTVQDPTALAINPAKVFKVKVLGLDFNGLFTSSFVSRDRTNFEEAPYEFDRIIEAIDTDSYVKQAFFKYKELFWKEGWDIISENPDAVEYLYQRIDFLEEAMGRPFSSLLEEIVDNVVKFSNAFVVEARGNIQPYFPGKLKPSKGKSLPISGYYLIPTETVRIYRNQYNTPIAYRQQMDNYEFSYDKKDPPTWDANEVLHFYLDKKTGRPFGTPFIIGALDDVVSLRQIEEDVLNLIHKDLFPLMKYTVGTEDKPSTPEEIDDAAAELANVRTEGGIIIPERHSVEIIGGEGSALEVSEYLKQFKERVAVGLGLAPHHLGMLSSGGNRSVTDRLDIALYDKIKLMQAYFEETIRLYIFNPLLREGGFNPITTPKAAGDSDRCFIRFREIDIDTQIKKQNHEMQKYANNIIELDEIRISLGLDPDVDPSQLLMTMQAQVATAQQAHLAQVNALLTPVQTKSPTGASTTKPPKALPPAATKPDAVQPSLGGRPNTPNNKGTKNANRPANQHGRRLSPNVRHMDDDILTEIVNLIDEGDFNE